LEEHPLDCDVDTVFGKYGLPMDFWDDGCSRVFEKWWDDGKLKPLKIRKIHN